MHVRREMMQAEAQLRTGKPMFTHHIRSDQNKAGNGHGLDTGHACDEQAGATELRSTPVHRFVHEGA